MPNRDAVETSDLSADSERISREFEEFERNVKCFTVALDELRDEHPNEWVTIFEQLWSADSLWVP